MMGLNIGMRYKNIDFASNFYGTFGNDIYNVTKGRYSGSGGQNVWAGTLEKAWHGAVSYTHLDVYKRQVANHREPRLSWAMLTTWLLDSPSRILRCFMVYGCADSRLSLIHI